jgi:hypothetical protein
MCSIEREPRRQDHTIYTAVAQEAVFTVRTKATSAAYGPALVFKSRRIQTHNSSSTVRSHSRTRNMSRVSCAASQSASAAAERPGTRSSSRAGPV